VWICGCHNNVKVRVRDEVKFGVKIRVRDRNRVIRWLN